jgi:hypothetical protein
MPAKINDLKKRIDEWTVDVLTDEDKMQAWVEKMQTNNKENALDELFGVK